MAIHLPPKRKATQCVYGRRIPPFSLNIQRACQAAQDLANRMIRTHQLGLPQNARESFLLLADAKLITPDLAATLISMVGFRNIAVHEYQRLNIAILRAIIEKHLADLLRFSNQLLALTS